MSSSSYFFTTLNERLAYHAINHHGCNSEKTSKPWEPSPYCFARKAVAQQKTSECSRQPHTSRAGEL